MPYRVEDVTFKYPTRPGAGAATTSASQCIAGESLGVIGPTGSGKSTLLDVLLGVL